jgi:glucose-1-phosphate adenylyltransferase
MSNSGIYNIGVITKYNYGSLMDHLGDCTEWDLNRKPERLLILPPFASGNMGVYKGKLEALYSAVSFIDNPKYDCVVVCDSTVLCNINLRKAVKKHLENGADITVICNKEADKTKKHPLVVKADKNGRVEQLLINSETDDECVVGMGMFIFSREALVKAIRESYAKGLVHLERDFIQPAVNHKLLKVESYLFDGVVLRNENIVSYFANNMALLKEEIRSGLFKKDSPIYTKVRDEIPTYYGEGNEVNNCILADGCEIYGKAEDSVLFRGVKLAGGAVVKNSIIMQGTKIGKNAKLECVILDKNVVVTDGAELKGTPEHPVIVKKGETV